MTLEQRTRARSAAARPPAATPDRAVVRGGTPLVGRVTVGGFKHAAVLSLAAAVLSRRARIQNLPGVDDTAVLLDAIESLGGGVDLDGATTVIDAGALAPAPLPEDALAAVHGSIYLVPAILARLGRVDIPHPGGCRIGSATATGARPTHHIVDVLRRFGADVSDAGGRIVGRVDRYVAARIDIGRYSTSATAREGPLISGATKTAILAASVARGTSVIEAPYRRCEIGSLIDALRSAGAAVDDQGGRLVIEGRDGLDAIEHRIGPDVIEVVTLVAAAVHTGGDVVIAGVDAPQLARAVPAEVEALARLGVSLEEVPGGVAVRAERPLRGTTAEADASETTIFSDSQPLLALVMLSASSRSTITDRVWPGRFDYAARLRELGANVRVDGNTLIVSPSRLRGGDASVAAGDLRAAAALLVAAVGRPATTTVSGLHHLARGYEALPSKLRALGADITSV